MQRTLLVGPAALRSPGVPTPAAARSLWGPGCVHSPHLSELPSRPRSSCEDPSNKGKSQAVMSRKWAPYPLANREMIMTGPKDSSRAMNMWSSTSVKTVGSKKKPLVETEEFMTLWVAFLPQAHES